MSRASGRCLTISMSSWRDAFETSREVREPQSENSLRGEQPFLSSQTLGIAPLQHTQAAVLPDGTPIDRAIR